jgi:TrmH family RNA methyltransferase
MEKITSLQNARIKQTLLLIEKPRERKLRNLFVIEGQRELGLALQAGYTIETLFICPEICDATLPLPQCRQCFEITLPVFQKLAYRNHSDGLLAVAQQKTHHLSALKLSQRPFVLVIEAVEKPGNLGAILRTADAARVDAVIVCDPLCEIYNPNTVRSGIGCLFTTQVACCSSEEAFAFLTTNNIHILAAELQGSVWYHATDMQQSTAVVFGTEADGLSDFWLRNAHRRIKIPMRGAIDSLNVSVSVAVIAFEAMRQRNFA